MNSSRRSRAPELQLLSIILQLHLLALPLVAAKTWLDPETSSAALKTKSLVDGRTFDLVFSDEFEVPFRTFHDGHDPRWTALHKNDYTNEALQFYDENAVRTNNGVLNNEIRSHISIL